MELTVKLGGAMVKFAPEGSKGSTHTIAIPSALSVQSVLDKLEVPADQPLMVILNDSMVDRTEYNNELLSNGDHLALVPPIQAG